MPIFEYKCKNCQKSFEHLLLPGRDDELLCPACGSPNAEKQLTLFSKPKNSRTVSGGEGACCGMETPCDSQKRCCET